MYAVREAGGLPLILPPVLGEGEASLVLSPLDGLILSGGWDIAPEWYGEEESPLVERADPERDRAELALVREALRAELPLLAICRGVQLLNVALGGTLYLDVLAQVSAALLHRPAEGQPKDASVHQVRLAVGSRLAAILGTTEVRVNSFHHQAVRDVGDGLVVTAHAPDGVVEGLEYRTHPFCVGVQWHPEIPIGNQEGMERLFVAFIEAASER